MGLDMYAYAVKAEHVEDGTADLSPRPKDESVEAKELAYWRKHHDLHGWMERLYRKKGGEAESFNCVSVRLTKEDLDLLEWDVREGKLPHTEGFFFGNYPPNKETNAEDLRFIEAARKAIEEGDIVFYDSWW